MTADKAQQPTIKPGETADTATGPAQLAQAQNYISGTYQDPEHIEAIRQAFSKLGIEL